MPAPASPSSLGYRLLLEDPLTVPTSIIVSPPHSLLAALRRVALGSWSKPEHSARQGGPRLRPSHRFAVEPLGKAGMLLDAYTPIVPCTDTTVGQHVERLRDMPDTVVTNELVERFGSDVPDEWTRVADEPGRWRRSWAEASTDSWTTLDALWQTRRRQLDREVRRASMAIARGGTDALLNSLHPRLRYRGGVLSLSSCLDDVYALAGRRLVLVPMIGAGGEIIVGFDHPEVAFVAYPVPTRARTSDTRHEDNLAVVLGAARSAALHALVRPYTVGELAGHLNLGVATASYHCDQLERAGLVRRTRVGRRVIVCRTFRGGEIVELFSP